MGNTKQLLLFFLLMVVKWNFAVSGYELPTAVISSGVLPSDDESETEEETQPANIVMNEIPVQEHQEMIPHTHKETPPANHLLNLIGTSGSSANVYNELTTFLSQLNLSPGKTTQVEIIPPEGSNNGFLKTLMGDLKTIVPKLVTNAPVSFKLGATKNIDDTLRKIQLGIIVGPAIQEGNDRFEKDEVPRSNVLPPINVDLTSPSSNPDIELARVLQQGLNKAKPYIDLGKPSEMVFHITPPSGFSTYDEQNTIRRITRILNGYVPPNVRTIVRGRSINNPDGTVQNIDVHISLQPTEVEASRENIEVDLSSSGQDIPKTLEETLLMIINGGNPKSFNLRIIPPIGSSPGTAQNIANTVNSFLMRLIPDRKPKVNYKISQRPDGSVDIINVEVDLEPSGKPSNPNELQFDADLSNPTSSLREEILRIIPTIKNVIAKRPNREPVSINLDIKPPKGITNEYITNTLETTQKTLLELLPLSNIGVQARITKDSQGNIVNISVKSTIEPISQNTENEFDVDISKPGSNLIDILINLTPQLKKTLDNQQPDNKPASLTLNIQPPKGATDQFVRNSMNTVTTFLSKLLPDKEISVRAKANKDTNGEIINTSLFITAEPVATTEQPKNPEEITIDLSDPKVDLDDVILDIIPRLQKKNNENKPRSVSLNLIPPKGSGIQFVKNTINYIVQKLAKYLPNDKIKVQSKITKDSEDNIVNINLNIIGEQSPIKEEPNKRKTININLSEPGIDIDEQIIQIIPSIQSIIKHQPHDEPVEFTLNIQPPEGSTDEFVRLITNKVRTDLEKVLPGRNIKIEPKSVKDVLKNIINIGLDITIEPSENTNVNENADNPFLETVVTTETSIDDQKIITVNLKEPGVNIVQEIMNILPILRHNVEQSEINEEPVTFGLDIQPPEGANDEFVNDTSNTIVTTLSQLFPNNRIGVRAQTTKDDKGNTIDISYVVDIQPKLISKEEKPTTPSSEEPTEDTEKTPKTFTVNLEQPGVDLEQEIITKLPTLKHEVQEKKPTDKPVTFEMNVQPPKGAKDNFVKDTSNNLITTLSHLFPKNKIGVRAKTTKDDKGNVIDITYIVDIQPAQHSDEPVEEFSTRPTTPSSEEIIPRTTQSEGLIEVTEVATRKPSTITVNLEKPGVDLEQEIITKLPTLKHDVEKKKPNDKPVSFEMDVQPPKDAKDDFVKDTSNNLITTLSHLFPKNKIGVRAKTTKDDKGNVIDITYIVDIQPAPYSDETEEEFSTRPTTTSSEETAEEINPTTTQSEGLIEVTEITTRKPSTITVNLEQPGVDLKQEIITKLPTLKHDVEKKKPNDKPVSFEMDVQPPKDAKDDFVKDTSNNLITTLSHLFPKNKIGVRAKTTKDDKGNVIDITYIVDIQPAPYSDETEEEFSTRPTTTSSEETAEEINPTTTQSEGLIEVTEITTRKPSTITVNLEQPGVDLKQEIITKLPTLKHDVEKKKPNDKPVSFELNVQPPKDARDDFVKDTSNNLITTLSHLFPKNKIGVRAKTTKDDKGNIIDISYVVDIQPAPASEETVDESSTRPTTPSSEETAEKIIPRTTESEGLIEVTEVTTRKPSTITVNLEQPGVDLKQEIITKLPTLKHDVEEKKPNDKPVTFEMNVKPPKDAKDNFVTDTSNNLITTLSHLFPKNKIGVRAKPTKDDKGNVIDVSYVVDIQPAPSSEETVEESSTRPTTPSSEETAEGIIPRTTQSEGLIEVTELTTRKPSATKEETVNVDLSKPGSSLPEEVEEILPKVFNPLRKDLNQGKPVTISFDIEPPPRSTSDFLQTAPKSLFPILTKYFPDNKINLRTTAKKNSQGFLTDVVLSIDIEPNDELHTTPAEFIDLVVTAAPEEPEKTTPIESHMKNVDIDSSEQTTPHEPEITTFTESKRKNVIIDLSEPNTSLPKEVEKTLPKVVEPLNKDLNEGKPVTLNFDVEPAPRTTSDFLKTAPQSLLPILSKYFPNNKINLKTTAKKNSQGFLTDIVFSVDIEPSDESQFTTPLEQEENETTPSTNKEKNIDIDLSEPDSSLPEEVEKTLPKIVEPLKKDLNEGKPVTLNFDVEPAPRTTSDFLKTAPQSLLPILTKYFPNNKINLKTTAKKNSQGFLTDIVFSVDIEPSDESPFTTPVEPEEKETTPPTNKEKNIDIDLSEPDSSLPEEVEKNLPKIVEPLKKDLNEGKPVTLNFDVEPAPRTTSDFLKTAPQSLLPILTKYFPNNKINLKTTAKKNSQGFLTDIVFSVDIEPSDESPFTTPVEPEEKETTPPTNKKKNIDIDLSEPDSSLPEEVEKNLPKIVEPLKKDLNEGKPVTLNFDVEPAPRTTSDFLKTAPQSLLPILTKYFPNNKINLKTTAKKNSQGFLTDIVFSVDIEPSDESPFTTPVEPEEKETTPPTNKEKNIDIDLSEPDSSLPEKVEKNLPKIVEPLKKDLNEGKPVTLNFDVEPAPRTTSDFLKTAPQSLLPILTKYFPNNKINLKTTAKKNSQGFLTDIVFSVDIEPSDESPFTTPVEPEEKETTPPTNKEKNIDIDLSEPDSSLPEEVEKNLPKIVEPLKKDLNEGKPVTLNFDVEPAPRTTSDFLKTAPQSLLPILTKYFPNNKINLKTTAKKNSQGFLTDIVFSVDIEPSDESPFTTPVEPEEKETTPPTNKEKNIDIDLSEPDSSLPEEVEKNLPKIVEPLKKDLNEGKPVTLNFDVEPAPRTTSDFLKTAPQSLLPIITKYFPNNKINLKTTAKKNSQGFLTDIVFSVDIEPSDESQFTTPVEPKENETTPSTNEEKNIDIDLSEPDSSLPEEVEKTLPKIVEPLKKDLNEGKPVTLNFDVEPAPRTTSDFLKTAPQSLLPILTKYFPNNKINLKTTAKKNSQGFLTDIVFSVDIEPSDELQFTTPVEPEENETTPSTNKEKNIEIDLSEPDSSLPEEVEKTLPKIIEPLKEDLNEGKPVTLNFDVEPAPKTTSDFLKTAPQSLLPILTKYFPNNKINLKTTAKKNSQGFLTDVVFSVDIEPNNEFEITTPVEPEENDTTTPSTNLARNINIDLSEPDSSLSNEVEKTLPKIIDPVKKDLNEGKPVTLNFDVEPAPRTTSDYLQTAPQSLFPILTKYFPNNKINLKTTAKKNSQGFITDVVFSVDIEPSGELEKTTPIEYIDSTTTTALPEPEKTTPVQSHQKNVDINLSEPGTKLPDIVQEILPSVVKPIKKDLDEGNPVTLNFNIEPPPRSNSDFLQTAPQSLVPILSEYFPDNKISVKTKARKNNQGFLTDVILSVIIEPSNNPETTTPAETREKNVDIDLSQPGSSLPEEVEEVLPNIIEPVKNNLDEGTPVVINFNIEPPPRSTSDFLKTAPQSLVPILTKYFPYNKISLKTNAKENSQGFLTDVILSISIEPTNEHKTTTPAETQKKNVDIDLSQPGSSLPDEVEQVLPYIITPLKNDLDGGAPVVLNFNIEPPPRSTSDFLKTAPQSLVPILTKYFPYNKISLKTNAKQNSQGFLTDVVLSVNIEPINEPETTTPADTSDKNVNIDLSKPGSSLSDEVEEILPEVINPVNNDLNEGNPVTLNFNIQPPPRSTSDFLQTAPQSIVPILSKYFPNNKISLKTNAREDSQGFLTDVVLIVNIEPSDDIKKTKKNIDIDLTKPGASLPDQVDELLPNVLEPIRNNLREGTPTTINFNIDPPLLSTSDFLKTAPKSIVPILSKYFPNDKISLKTNAKQNSQGYLTEVVLSVIIEPNNESKTPKERNVDIDLSQPGSTLPGEMKDIMPFVVKPVKEDLKKRTPVTLNFNIEPPPRSTANFLQTAPQSIVSILTDYFPTNKMSLKTNAKKNSWGYLSDVVLSITIEPSEEDYTPEENPTSGNDININLSEPGSSFSTKVNSLLPNVVPNVQAGLKNQEPVTIKFNIQPPPWATQDALQSYANSLTSIISSYFPNNQISVQTNGRKNSQGYLTFATLAVTIDPSTSPQEESNGLRINLDFSSQYNSMSDQVNQVMPSIIHFVQDQPQNGQPQILYFDIKLPRWASEEYIKSVTNYLESTLSQTFPQNQIQVQISNKRSDQGLGSALEMKVTLMPWD